MGRSRSLSSRVGRQGVRLAGAGVTVRQETGALLDSMSEREFQREHVVSGLKWRRWIVMVIPDMRRVEAGWPDVTAWHPDIPGVLLVWEIKTMTGRASHAQKRLLRHLRTVRGIDARIVRPSTWPLLLRALDCPDPAAELARIEEGRV